MNELIPIIGVLTPVVALMIPIVALLTRHQRSMAELYHSRLQQPTSNPEMEMLRGEVRELRERLNQQTISLDNLVQALQARPANSEQELSQRIGGTEN